MNRDVLELDRGGITVANVESMTSACRLLVLFPLLAACGGGVESGHGSGGAGNGGSGGHGGGGGGGGGSGSCDNHSVPDLTTYSLSVEGMTIPTDPPEYQPLDIVVEGRVLASAPGTLVVDPCQTANCTTGKATLAAAGSGLPTILVPVGAFVRLHYYGETRLVGGGALAQVKQTLVENLPTWAGSTNTVSPTQRIWLVVHSSPTGGVTDFDPYTVDSVDGCSDGNGQNFYSLAFGIPGAAKLTVPSGETRTVDATGARAGHYTIRTLGASSNIDGFGSVSYWISGS